MFLWSEDHAREYRKKSHRTRGLYSPVDRLVEPFKTVQSAIFGFDTAAE